jgi:hypothetical protein
VDRRGWPSGNWTSGSLSFARGKADADAIYDGALAVEKARGKPTEDLATLASRVIVNSKKKLTGHVIAEDNLFDVVRRTAKIAGM